MAANIRGTLLLSKGDGAKQDILLDFDLVHRAARTLRSMNHNLRRQILKLIEENGKLTVTEIYIRLRLEQSVASQHLAILRKSGVVKTQRDGKHIFYMVNKERIQQIVNLLPELAEQ